MIKYWKFWAIFIGILLLVSMIIYWVLFKPLTSTNLEVFGTFLSGFFGTIFGFLTIILLLYFENKRTIEEAQRRDEADFRDDINTINNAISQNRDIFNNIKFYDQHSVGPLRSTGMDYEIVQFSGPEAFCQLYQSFLNKYMKYINYYFSTREGEFVNSIEDPNIISDLISKGKIILDKAGKSCKINPNHPPKNYLLSIIKLLPRGIENIISFDDTEFINDLLIRNAMNSNPKGIVTIIKDSFDDFFKEFGHLFGHYLRNQYYVFETISDCFEQKSKQDLNYYFRLYRSHLSAYELTIMFYNSISQMSSLKRMNLHKKSYRYFIREYQLLDDLDKIDFIHSGLFSKYGYDLISAND